MTNLTELQVKTWVKEAVVEVMEEQNSKLFNTEKIYTSEESANFLKVSMSQFYKLTALKKIPYSKPTGKIMYFKESDLIAFKLSNTNINLDGEILAKHLSK